MRAAEERHSKARRGVRPTTLSRRPVSARALSAGDLGSLNPRPLARPPARPPPHAHCDSIVDSTPLHSTRLDLTRLDSTRLDPIRSDPIQSQPARRQDEGAFACFARRDVPLSTVKGGVAYCVGYNQEFLDEVSFVTLMRQTNN